MTITKPTTYSFKVLEKVAREIGEVYKGYQIQNILLDAKIPQSVIPTPSSKWYMVNEAFKHLKVKYQKADDEISKLIMEFLNPLNHNLKKEYSENFVKKIKEIVELDNVSNSYIGKDFLIFTDSENNNLDKKEEKNEEDPFAFLENYSEEYLNEAFGVKGKKEDSCKTEEKPEVILENLVKVAEQKNVGEIIGNFNKEDVTKLSKNEKIYMLKVLYSYYEAIISSYYGSGLFFVTNGIDDLNDCFKLLRKKIIDLVGSDETFSELKNSEVFHNYIEDIKSVYVLPELLDILWEDAVVPSLIDIREQIADKDLFENNKEIHPSNKNVVDFLNLTNNEIRILQTDLAMRTKRFYEKDASQIKENYSSEKEETKEEVIRHEHKHYHENVGGDKPQKIEIVNSELNIKNVDNKVIQKGEKIIKLPKIRASDWGKIEIRFITPKEVIIKTDFEQGQYDFETLGFRNDRSKIPNTAWMFLFKMSLNRGKTPKLPPTIKGATKQHKLTLVNMLKTIFNLTDEPFYDYDRDLGRYEIKMKLTPPVDYEVDLVN